MTVRSTDKARADAQELRDRLKAEGRPFDAEIVTRLIRASVTSTSTNELLYRDNMDLRGRLTNAPR